jgi:hypothetical protein
VSEKALQEAQYVNNNDINLRFDVRKTCFPGVVP